MALMEVDAIMRILPHRYPMLLIDRILECDNEAHIIAIKNVTTNEPFFQGHFPGKPVMPGVLQLEAMAQAGGVLLNLIAGNPEGVPFFMSIDKAKFRRVVRPGDQMRIEVWLTKKRATMGRFRAEIRVEGDLVSEAELMCMITSGEAA